MRTATNKVRPATGTHSYTMPQLILAAYFAAAMDVLKRSRITDENPTGTLTKANGFFRGYQAIACRNAMLAINSVGPAHKYMDEDRATKMDPLLQNFSAHLTANGMDPLIGFPGGKCGNGQSDLSEKNTLRDAMQCKAIIAAVSAMRSLPVEQAVAVASATLSAYAVAS